MAGILLFIALMGGSAVLTVRWPAVGIGLLLSVWAFQQWLMTQHGLFVRYHTLPNIAVALVLAIGIMVHVSQRRPIFSTLPVIWWIYLLLLGLSVLSIMWSVYPEATMSRWSVEGPRILVYTLLASLVFCSATDVRIGFVSALVIGLITLPLVLFDTQVTGRMVQVETVYLGATTGMTTPLGVARAAATIALIAGLTSLSGFPRPLQVTRWLVVLVCTALIIRSGSRGEFLTTLLAMGICLPLARGFGSPKQVAAVVVGFVVVGLGAFFLFDHLTAIADPSAARWEQRDVLNAIQVRINMITVSLSAWVSSSPVHWLVGIGTAGTHDPTILGIYPHNAPVESLVTLGLIGAALYGTFCALTVRAAMRVYRAVRHDPEVRGLAVTVIAITMFYFITSLKSGDLLSSYFFFLFAIILGKFEIWVRQTVPALYGQSHLIHASRR